MYFATDLLKLKSTVFYWNRLGISRILLDVHSLSSLVFEELKPLLLHVLLMFNNDGKIFFCSFPGTIQYFSDGACPGHVKVFLPIFCTTLMQIATWIGFQYLFYGKTTPLTLPVSSRSLISSQWTKQSILSFYIKVNIRFILFPVSECPACRTASVQLYATFLQKH